MNDETNGTAKKEQAEISKKINESENISLKNISELTGFPIEFVRNELLVGTNFYEKDGVPLNSLREIMKNYLTSTMSEYSDSSEVSEF